MSHTPQGEASEDNAAGGALMVDQGGMGLVAKVDHYFTFDGSGGTSQLMDAGTAASNLA